MITRTKLALACICPIAMTCLPTGADPSELCRSCSGKVGDYSKCSWTVEG